MDTPLPEPAPAGSLAVLACTITGPQVDGRAPWARVAQYADCVQLQLWLPELHPPKDWQRLQLRDAQGRLLLDEAMDTLLQAGHRLLLDAAAWPAGLLSLQASHRSGVQVRVQLRRSTTPATLPQPAATADPAEDLRLRDRHLEQLARRFAWRLSYENHGRSGRVLFHDRGSCLAFAWEMTGDEAEPLSIAVPPPAEWERCTGRPLGQREAILRFVADTAQREQTRSWQAELRDEAIVFLARQP